jgi:hypothetical protein
LSSPWGGRRWGVWFGVGGGPRGGGGGGGGGGGEDCVDVITGTVGEISMDS